MTSFPPIIVPGDDEVMEKNGNHTAAVTIAHPTSSDLSSTAEAAEFSTTTTTEPPQQQQQQMPEPEETTNAPLNSNETLTIIPTDPKSGEESVKEDTKKNLEPGDHVYMWCSVLGIPGVFQHHGIVIHAEDIIITNDNEEEADDEDHEQLLTIADFSNLLLPSGRGAATNSADADSSTGKGTAEVTEAENQPSDCDKETIDSSEGSSERSESPPGPTEQPTGSLCGGTPLIRSGSSSAKKSKDGCLRIYRTASTKKNRWRKVQYQDSWVNIHLRKRSGTCTASPSDPPEVVMKRVNFLLQQSKLDGSSSSVLPKYHSIFANCECVAVWCKTGIWSTLQASSFLSHAAVGQVKGTAVIATAAASAQATVPAAGMMGWMGFTTTVPLMSVQPLLLPAICAYGAVTIGGPAAILAYAKSSWKETTKRLNEALGIDSLEVVLVT